MIANNAKLLNAMLQLYTPIYVHADATEILPYIGRFGHSYAWDCASAQLFAEVSPSLSILDFKFDRHDIMDVSIL